MNTARIEEALFAHKIIEAKNYLADKVIKTPIRRLHWLERIVGVPVYAKLEHFQYSGSFKYRGACYSLRNHDPEQLVVAASAGNHGFAVAEVCRLNNLNANICLPTTASLLKRSHILETGVGLIEYGNSLDEAIEHVLALAKKNDWKFISPYNSQDVIAANGSFALEFMEQVDGLKSIIAPIGGGGLISGISQAVNSSGQNIEVIGCEPKRYGTLSSSIANNNITKIVHQPTFADGLAVNLEDNSITFEMVRDNVSDIVLLSEEELAAATYSLLIHESLLVEPAGAAAVIACIRLAQQGKLHGPVGIPLCGGNLHHTTLSKIQRFAYQDPSLLGLLNVKGPKLADAQIKKVLSTESKGVIDESEVRGLENIKVNLDECLTKMKELNTQLNNFKCYCEMSDVQYSEQIVDFLAKNNQHAANNIEETLARWQGKESFDIDQEVIQGEGLLRFGLQSINYAKGALEWCAPSYAQSIANQFFDLGYQENPACNYERYELTDVKNIENQVLETFGADTVKQGIVATSSGMAAYSLIEAFIVRYRLSAGDCILVSPYIYFEASEQLSSLNCYDIVFSEQYTVECMIDNVTKYQPKVVFVDPLANTTEQRMVDINGFLARLATVVSEKVTVVIDGTMLPCQMDSDWFSISPLIEVIYYESGSKYLQLGLDLNLSGFVVHDNGLTATFDRIRRNTGLMISRSGAALFPRYSPQLFVKRLKAISSNANFVAERLLESWDLLQIADIHYPGHSSHPDYELAKSYRFTGGCITFKLKHDGNNHRDQLESLIENILFRARSVGLMITKGVSFGYTVPRISAASSLAEFEDPFLRLYVGALSLEQMELLVSVIRDGIINTEFSVEG